MIIDKTIFTFRNALRAFRREGFVPALRLLFKDAFRFLTNYIFNYERYYLYEHTIENRDASKFLLKIQKIDFYILASNKEAKKLTKYGEDFRDYIYGARRSLDKGAIAFCFFVDRELAHIGWVALTEEAKQTFEAVPYQVDFSNKEACTGGTLTLPKYRGKGLMTYGYYKRFQFLLENGIRISRNAVKSDNHISQRVHAKFHPKIYGEARFIRFLKWKLRYRIKNELHN